LDIFSIAFFVKCTSDDDDNVIIPNEVKPSEIGLNLIGKCVSCGKSSVVSMSLEQLSQLIKATIRQSTELGEYAYDQQEVATPTTADIIERSLCEANMNVEVRPITARTMIENFLNGKYTTISPCFKPSKK